MKKTYTLGILIFLLLNFKFTSAQNVVLDATLIELNFHDGSYPQRLIPFQTGFYFTATDDDYYGPIGRELWYSNGTAEGTSMIKDIFLGKNSSNPTNFLIIGDNLFFTANNGLNGVELWISNGTESGTNMVKDIGPNNTSAYTYDGPNNFVSFKDKLYFTASDGINGFELWESDGTALGTMLVKDINPNEASSYPNNLFVFNNMLYFIANDGTNGTELWKSDGTESGTMLIKDIYPNNSGLTSGNQFLILNNQFYFFANDGANGTELWKSDGTESGTIMVKDIKIGNTSSANTLIGSVLNDIIVFQANDGVNGNELWKSDGTESGTIMIKDINSSYYGSIISSGDNFVKFNNYIYFIANDNVYGSEIWKTDGTLNGTTLLKDINNGIASIWIDKFHIDEVNNKLLFFTNSTNSSDQNLWVSDGTSIGTFELSNIKDSNISDLEESFVSINNMTIITGEDDTHGNELWITDGTISGTSLFVDLVRSKGSNPAKFTDVDGELFFRANGSLFKSNGTVEDTKMVKAIGIDDLSDMKNINGTLFFSAIDGIHGYELWKSNGTESGTIIVKDINSGSKSSMRYNNENQPFTVINDILYFYADDGVHGFELWRSDGSESGTYMIKDIKPGSDYFNSSYPRSFVLLNDIIYFIAHDSTGSALWTTDGTESGTSKIINLKDMRVLKTVNNKLIIVAETSGTSYGPHDLWVSDGTAEGTQHIKSFGDNIDSDIQFTTILNDELYFVAKSPDSYRKAIYKTDGTLEGTKLIYDAATHPNNPELDINVLISSGEYVYFVNKIYGNPNDELWRTDGTVDGTLKITDEYYIKHMVSFKDNLFFLSGSDLNIWVTNGSQNGLFKIDIQTENNQYFENYSGIEELGVSGDKIYFRARNSKSGSELYVTTPSKMTSDNILDDLDSDGVLNLIDKCPDTPLGEIVDSNGCSESQLDDDDDDVMNDIDTCPNTPIGETVNVNGCSESQLDDDDGDGIMNYIDTCPNTPTGETINENGCSQSQLDDDGDGVMNNLDLCPNTNSGTDVNENGCFFLSPNNFSIVVISETCPDKKNGELTITANETYGYTATINNVNHNFTNNSLTVSNLTPGTYTVCISITGETFEQCYTITVAEGKTVSGKASVLSNKALIAIEQGTAPYDVYVNGISVLNTLSPSFTIEVKHGDLLEVKTAKSCEGVFLKAIDLFEDITVYPNPSKGIFEITLPISEKEVVIELYTMGSQLISKRTYQVVNGKVQLNLENKPTGVYIIKIYLDTTVSLTIIKE